MNTLLLPFVATLVVSVPISLVPAGCAPSDSLEKSMSAPQAGAMSSCQIPAPTAHAVPKVGDCPIGYRTTGDFCTPNSSSSRYAVSKVGSCPSGYGTSGAYCLASSARACHAMPRGDASCPPRYRASGAYCLAS
jgi:hypothetical protein